jgi:hypothetical protein
MVRASAGFIVSIRDNYSRVTLQLLIFEFTTNLVIRYKTHFCSSLPAPQTRIFEIGCTKRVALL